MPEPKRKRGRPRKNPELPAMDDVVQPRGPGRPPKDAADKQRGVRCIHAGCGSRNTIVRSVAIIPMKGYALRRRYCRCNKCNRNFVPMPHERIDAGDDNI